jgi:hypothetical protein
LEAADRMKAQAFADAMSAWAPRVDMGTEAGPADGTVVQNGQGMLTVIVTESVGDERTDLSGADNGDEDVPAGGLKYGGPYGEGA